MVVGAAEKVAVDHVVMLQRPLELVQHLVGVNERGGGILAQGYSYRTPLPVREEEVVRILPAMQRLPPGHEARDDKRIIAEMRKLRHRIARQPGVAWVIRGD